jgi:uncharacterized BrkB/YihY/UPF0761 family membrane protein
MLNTLKQKFYWEKEKDKCFSNILTFTSLLATIPIKTSNYPVIKRINKTSWASSSGWDKFNYVLDWILIIIFLIYLPFAIYYLIRINTCYRKLNYFNQRLLEELGEKSETKKSKK